MNLSDLARALEAHPFVREKATIAGAYRPAESVAQGIPLGDDCAAIPDLVGEGYLLFAAEGILNSFVRDDPWFAGYSAVMVNLSDIAAMGGRSLAITNVLSTPDHPEAEEIWQGMQAASRAYNVPIVGGHTTLTGKNGTQNLAASVLGRATNLITSFDAEEGDELIIAIDMKGAYRREKPFWNASVTSSPSYLQKTIDLLPQLAESGLCRAGKDISNGGIIGTLVMLLQCSEVGALVDLDRLPIPQGTEFLLWLTSFPSFGYLLSVNPKDSDQVVSLFESEGITSCCIGEIKSGSVLQLSRGEEVENLSFHS